jgi:hypothetical protein
MAGSSSSRLPLVMVNDTNPNYNWFGNLDYGWFNNLGTLASVPYFGVVPEEMAQMVQNSSARQPLSLKFGADDCVTAEGATNCTDVCSDPSALFSPANLRACTALASAALLVQDGTYSVDQTDAETVRIAEAWRVPDLSTYNGTAVLDHLAGCISESCTIASRLGECPDDLRNLTDIPLRVDSLGSLSSRLQHYCDNLDVEINPDIAGPGVSLEMHCRTD